MVTKFIIESFYERYVQVLTDIILHTTTEDGIIQGNLTYEGYLVKFDPEYIYLGNENNEVLHAIDRKHLVSISDILLYSEDEENKSSITLDPSEMN